MHISNKGRLASYGFTLIELSITLVIIGLLIGGVLVGRDLMAASAIRSQISQVQELISATNSFKIKYGYLPGDMPPSQASQMGFFMFTGTWAGKGCVFSGLLAFAYGNNDGVINAVNESNAFWSQISDAKMIKGGYAGTAGNLLTSATTTCNSNIGLPISAPTTDADYNKFQPRAKIISANVFFGVYGNRYYAPSNNITYSNSSKLNTFYLYNIDNSKYPFTPYQLYQIDNKIDDGYPAYGNVRDSLTADYGTGTANDDPPCTTSSVVPIKYDMTPATANNLNCYGIDFLF